MRPAPSPQPKTPIHLRQHNAADTQDTQHNASHQHNAPQLGIRGFICPLYQ
jgi:hypothetical protein